METVTDFFSLGSKITLHGDSPMTLKNTCSLEVNYNILGQHIKKQRHYFVYKGPSGQGYGFSSSHGWM